MKKAEIWLLSFFFCAIFLLTAGFSFGKPDWKPGVQTVGIRVRVSAQGPTVHFEQKRGWGLSGLERDAREKDENLKARLMLALRDFSFSDEIFKEFDFAFRQHTAWKAVSESQFGATPPDLLIHVNVVEYGLLGTGKEQNAKVFFEWETDGIRQPTGETVWKLGRKKISSSRNLKRWMMKNSDMIKGELRAHILFSVQDLMRKTGMRNKKIKG